MVGLATVTTVRGQSALFDYPDRDLPPAFDSLCEGTIEHNGFYGDGIVNALSAVLR